MVAKKTWEKLLKGMRSIYFVNNESARLGLVRAYGPVLPSLLIIMDCLRWDLAHTADSWYSRVPSKSKISDGPLRLEFDFVCNSLGCRRIDPVCP